MPYSHRSYVHFHGSLELALHLALPGFLALPKNNCTEITHREGNWKVNRVKNLRNEYVPNWKTEREVDCTSRLLVRSQRMDNTE